MKKLVILTLLLAAGLTAYPQSASRSRESKSRSSSTVSKSSKATNRSANVSSRSGSERSKAATSRSVSAGRSESVSRGNAASRSSAIRSGSTQSQNRSSISSRSGSAQTASRSRSAVQADRQSEARNRSAVSQSAARVKTESRSGQDQSRIVSGSSATRSRSTSGDSFNRGNRQGDKVYVRSDGSKYRHQNDEVFATRKYRVDFRSADELRRSDDFRRVYRDYERWHHSRYRREVVYHYHIHPPLSIEIRRVRYPYRRPVHVDLCWTPWLHHRFMYYYPMHNRWNLDYGHYIETISSYEAMHYTGSVKRVYGRVEEVYYSSKDQTYTLYFGAEFPYHDFSVVVPARIAKHMAWSPTWYFEDEYVWVVGLIDVWEGKPEIVVHDEDQIRRY